MTEGSLRSGPRVGSILLHPKADGFLKSAGLRLRFSDCREFYTSHMTKHLSVPEVDFVQGRIAASVFMRNYFNPTWIADLGERAVRGEKEMFEMICHPRCS